MMSNDNGYNLLIYYTENCYAIDNYKSTRIDD